MVDPRSWIRFSGRGDTHQSCCTEVTLQFNQYNYTRFLGHGCECMVCDQAVDTVEPILPIRNFYYPTQDGSNVLNDDFYLLCSALVRGYALNERKWGT
jgi:hypothetical protein